jgi:hypothetical protein
MDEFILQNKLRWIPYNKFINIEYLDKGGFGTIYQEVGLKCCNNLNESLDEFLNEVCVYYFFLIFNYNLFI